MSSYTYGSRRIEYADRENSQAIFLRDMIDGQQQQQQPSPDLLLSQKAEQMCKIEGINYRDLVPIQRLFLTHYRCPTCKLLPLYHLNLAHPKRVRCGRCSSFVNFTNSGKYGRLRKKLAFMLWRSSKQEESKDVS
jgi:hypothetical protein